MGVRRHKQRGDVGLSMDSLLDVFMNVIGVLMITAVVLALSVREQSEGAAASISKVPIKDSQPSRQETPRKPIRLILPEAEDVNTLPLYLLVTGEGIRPVNGDNSDVTDRYFSRSYNQITESLVLDPIPGLVISREELQDWLRSHNPSSWHVMAIITPGGTRYYRDLRKLVTQEGFRSGWTPHEGSQIVFGSEGDDGRTVQ